MQERIQSLLQEINRGIYEKETELAMALLAALAGESIILLGPPGVAKSMVARRLKSAFRNARSFEYLCLLNGIDVVYLEGDIAGETAETSGPHAWNLVCVDGAWSNVDTTWNDQTGSEGFFMVPDAVHNENLVEKLSPYEVPAA